MKHISLKYRILIISPLLALLLLVFQNCADPEVASQSSSVSINNFPYDASVDHIAYMSCKSDAQLDLKNEMYFSFKVAALRENSGLRFADNFQKIIKTYDATQIAGVLANSSDVIGAQLQLHVHARDLQGEAEGLEPTKILYPLDSGLIVQEFAALDSETSRFNFLTQVPGLIDRRFEGAVGLRGFYPHNIKSLFNDSDAILSLTYSSEDLYDSSSELIRPISSDPSRAFGVGFSLGFDATSRKITSVEEIDLETKDTQPADRWVCPSALQFKIVRQQDVQDVQARAASGKFQGALVPDVIFGMSDYEVSLIKRVRELIDPEKSKWYVDLRRGAIIPKAPPSSNDCYTSSEGQNATFPIDYYSDTNCGTAQSEVNCPHYMTICVRE